MCCPSVILINSDLFAGLDRMATRTIDTSTFTWMMDEDDDGNRIVSISLDKITISPVWTAEEEMAWKQAGHEIGAFRPILIEEQAARLGLGAV